MGRGVGEVCFGHPKQTWHGKFAWRAQFKEILTYVLLVCRSRSHGHGSEYDIYVGQSVNDNSVFSCII